jgi:ectoine hydroxylase-related dioxygenase (phytanoyl-CoA dioxygenase family)
MKGCLQLVVIIQIVVVFHEYMLNKKTHLSGARIQFFFLEILQLHSMLVMSAHPFQKTQGIFQTAFYRMISNHVLPMFSSAIERQFLDIS